MTIEDLAVKVDGLTTNLGNLSTTAEGLALAVNAGFAAIGKRLVRLEFKVDENSEVIRTLKERTGRVELAVYNIQRDIENIYQEMVGIHKVLDYLDRRDTRLENHVGLEPLEQAS